MNIEDIKKLRISIIIPCFNQAHTIGDCLSALLPQIKDFVFSEIIIVDCESTDASRDIAGKFPVSILHTSIRNAGHARNIGAKAASGDLLVFLDSDSIPASNFIGFLLKPYVSLPQLDFVIGNKQYKIHNQSLLNTYFISLVQLKLSGTFRAHDHPFFLDSAGFSIKKSVFQKAGGFNANLDRYEDREFGLRLLNMGFFSFHYNSELCLVTKNIDQPLYLYKALLDQVYLSAFLLLDLAASNRFTAFFKWLGAQTYYFAIWVRSLGSRPIYFIVFDSLFIFLNSILCALISIGFALWLRNKVQIKKKTAFYYKLGYIWYKLSPNVRFSLSTDHISFFILSMFGRHNIYLPLSVIQNLPFIIEKSDGTNFKMSSLNINKTSPLDLIILTKYLKTNNLIQPLSSGPLAITQTPQGATT